jgi:hypothetical protein
VPFEFDGQSYDIDVNSRKEGNSTSQPTYAAITSRSYHPNVVNAAHMDGSKYVENSRFTVELETTSTAFKLAELREQSFSLLTSITTEGAGRSGIFPDCGTFGFLGTAPPLFQQHCVLLL